MADENDFEQGRALWGGGSADGEDQKRAMGIFDRDAEQSDGSWE